MKQYLAIRITPDNTIVCADGDFIFKGAYCNIVVHGNHVRIDRNGEWAYIPLEAGTDVADKVGTNMVTVIGGKVHIVPENICEYLLNREA